MFAELPQDCRPGLNSVVPAGLDHAEKRERELQDLPIATGGVLVITHCRNDLPFEALVIEELVKEIAEALS